MGNVAKDLDSFDSRKLSPFIAKHNSANLSPYSDYSPVAIVEPVKDHPIRMHVLSSILLKTYPICVH